VGVYLLLEPNLVGTGSSLFLLWEFGVALESDLSWFEISKHITTGGVVDAKLS
jgi:hypothetical protein